MSYNNTGIQAQGPSQPQPVPNTNTTPSIPKDENLFAFLFFLMLDSMEVRQKTVVNNSQQLSDNAQIQDNLNKRDEQIQFPSYPAGADKTEMERAMLLYQQATMMHSDIQNELITARQTAQVTMTQTTTNINILEQDASENSGWLRTYMSIADVIVKITQNS